MQETSSGMKIAKYSTKAKFNQKNQISGRCLIHLTANWLMYRTPSPILNSMNLSLRTDSQKKMKELPKKIWRDREFGSKMQNHTLRSFKNREQLLRMKVVQLVQKTRLSSRDLEEN